MQQAQGDLAAALTSDQASLAIRERLAKAGPGNARRARDIANWVTARSPSWKCGATLRRDHLSWFDAQIGAQEK
jgi:hypothetical protein